MGIRIIGDDTLLVIPSSSSGDGELKLAAYSRNYGKSYGKRQWLSDPSPASD